MLNPFPFLSHGKRHPSAILLMVQLLACSRSLASIEMFVGLIYLAGVAARLIGLTMQLKDR